MNSSKLFAAALLNVAIAFTGQTGTELKWAPS